MVKIIPLALILFLIGCSQQPVKLRTETVEVYKPILYCPAPDWTGLDRPSPLAIDSITKNTSGGEVVKRYKATIKQLQDYTDRLEERLKQYDRTSKSYEELKKQFIREKELDGFTVENTPSE